MGENYGLPIMFFVNKEELLEIRGRLTLLTFYRYVFICPTKFTIDTFTLFADQRFVYFCCFHFHLD